MQERTLTVRGIGTVSLSPDLCTVTISLKALNKDYAAASIEAEAQLAEVQRRLTEEAGFDAEDLKTASFRVTTENESVPDENGRYHSVFRGYAVCHDLNLSFPFDPARLGVALSLLAALPSEPELSLRFSVSDKNAASASLLAAACADAREKAQVLAAASGVALGEILSITCGNDPPALGSRTEYMMDRACMSLKGASNSITPEDVKCSEEVTVVWRIG